MSNIRYGDDLSILGKYTVSTEVDTPKIGGWAAGMIARDYASSGTVGSVMAELATTGKCDFQALIEDIEATRKQLCYPGGNSIAARHAANMDNLSVWAHESAVEVHTGPVRQAAPDCRSEALSVCDLRTELHEIASTLLADGFNVYYYKRERFHRHVTWFIVERGGNLGTVQYDRISGYSVHFVIEPSRAVGSSLSVLADNFEPGDPATVQTVVLAAGLATQDTYRNFATPKALPNQGWKHFDWAKDAMIQVTAHDENHDCAHCGKPGGHGPGED